MGVSDTEMFEWGEKQRLLAVAMTNEQLARALIDDVFGSVGAAESEFACSDGDRVRYNMERGVLREAAYRLAKIREYEPST